MTELETLINYTNNSVKEKRVKVGRNEKCPCGSGKKYKKCCIKIERKM